MQQGDGHKTSEIPKCKITQQMTARLFLVMHGDLADKLNTCNKGSYGL